MTRNDRLLPFGTKPFRSSRFEVCELFEIAATVWPKVGGTSCF